MRFAQSEIEGQLSDIVPRGVRRDLAAATGIYESVMYGYYNADDERKSPAFCLLLIQAALDEHHSDIGDLHWQTICSIREAGRGAIDSDGLDEEIATFVTEANDVPISRLKHKPLRDQLREVRESVAEGMRLEQKLLAAIDAEKIGVPSQSIKITTKFPGQRVSHNARAAVKNRIGGNGAKG